MNWNPFKRTRTQTLTDFFEEKYKPQRLLTGSEKTKRAYFITFDRFSIFLGETARIEHLSDEKLAAFVTWRREETGVKDSTVARDMVQLKALWRFARDLGLIPLGPTVKTVSFVIPPPKAYTQEQLDAIYAAIQEESQPVLISSETVPGTYVPGPIWWSALFLTLWDTAERITAVLELRDCDVDLSDGFIYFRADTRKGGKEDNLQQVEPRTLEAIKALMAHYTTRRGNTCVFRWAANRHTIYSRWGRILERAGVPDIPRKKFHAIRSSRATHEHILGGDATAKLTHKSNVTTRKHYLDRTMIAKYMRKLNIFQPGASATVTTTAEVINVPAVPQPLLLTHQQD